MKKLFLPLILLLGAAAIAGWYVFLRDDGDAANGRNGVFSDSGKAGQDTDDVPFGDPPTEEELNREKLLREHARPQEFIILSYAARKNLLGETVIEGSLTNNAELTAYRDLRLIIYFDDNAGNAIDSAGQTVFDKIAPGGGKAEFKLKEKGPRKAREVRVKLKDAIVDAPG
jgi:hypothetical protein